MQVLNLLYLNVVFDTCQVTSQWQFLHDTVQKYDLFLPTDSLNYIRVGFIYTFWISLWFTSSMIKSRDGGLSKQE